MKKLWMMIALCMALSGCSAAPTFETLGEILHDHVEGDSVHKMQFSVPADAIGMGDAYFCEDYYFEVQTLNSGDLDGAIRTLCGFSQDDLTVMTAGIGDWIRYEWVWCAAGDEGDVICRAALIDDGNQYYCLTAVAPAEKGGAVQESWNALFSSFTVV